MQLIGEIVRLQVQTASLKTGQARWKHYDPAPLTAVPALTLDAGGVSGLSAAGEPIADVHHRDHPDSKNRGTNGISLCFTGHYTVMRDHFGPHLRDGIAGENLLVAFAGLLGDEDLAGGLMIETAAGDRIPLTDVIVATPCVEFARYALNFPADARPDQTVTAAVAFLNDGLRGYYAALAGPPTIVRPGDRLLLA